MADHWFISKFNENKFTNLPSGAKSVELKVQGESVPALLLAPGHIHSFARDSMDRQLKLWDLLLDLMEQEIEGTGDIRKMIGVQESLALLEYGEVTEATMKLVEAQAKARYEQEMEE